jgi:ORF6C domain/ORF6N domain
MNNIQIIEQNGVRVLTSSQLAESYGTDKQLIVNNFNRNRSRYTEGKHFIALEGAVKNDFINQHQIDLGSKNAKVLYLWTEKGAWLHAKSLNTNEAWDAYEKLVDDYYIKQEQIKILSEREQLHAVMKISFLQEEDIKHIKSDIELLKIDVANRITLDYGQQRALENAKKARVYHLWENGIINQNVHDTRKKVFAAIGRELKNAFAVASYKDIKQKDFDEAMNFVKAWRPRLI